MKRVDETGNKYGKYTVLGYDEEKKKWKCQCECGNIAYYNGTNLRQGVKSCRQCKIKNATNYKDLTGQKFGHLQAIKYIGKSFWLCQCDCGKVVTRKSPTLINGRSISCGCIHTKYKVEHDEVFKKLYKTWKGMRMRCNNKNDKSYQWYGGRGIKLCDEWQKSFLPFYEWAISNGFKIVDGERKDQLAIDRIDSDKNYSPDNCRWITVSENSYRVSENNVALEELMSKSTDEMVQQYIERKMEKNLEIQKEKREIRGGFFPCKKNNYCTLRNLDGTKQFIFKNFKTVALFLNITQSALSYRYKNKNGILTEEWRIEKITKEEFDTLKSRGIEVII
jgi:hypothetical protein